MEIKGIPALTRVLPVNATPDEKINLTEEQILELEQQIVCYRSMIRERKKIIKDLEKLKTGQSVRKSLMESLLGPRTKRLKLKKKKTKKKSKKRKKRSR